MPAAGVCLMPVLEVAARLLTTGWHIRQDGQKPVVASACPDTLVAEAGIFAVCRLPAPVH